MVDSSDYEDDTTIHMEAKIINTLSGVHIKNHLPMIEEVANACIIFEVIIHHHQ